VRKAGNLPPSCAIVTKSGNLNFLRTLWACPGLYWNCYTFYIQALLPYQMYLPFSVTYSDVPIAIKQLKPSKSARLDANPRFVNKSCIDIFVYFVPFCAL